MTARDRIEETRRMLAAAAPEALRRLIDLAGSRSPKVAQQAARRVERAIERTFKAARSE